MLKGIKEGTPGPGGAVGAALDGIVLQVVVVAEAQWKDIKNRLEA